MIKSNVGEPIQAFPIETTTQVFTSGVTAYEVKGPSLVHMNADGTITCHYNTDSTAASISVPAAAGSDFVVANDFDSIDVDASCIITRA